jgi:putative sigma-54 modulation protein
MEVQIKAKDYKVGPGLREFIQERMSKLDRFVGQGRDAKLELTYEHPRTGGERYTVQLTIPGRHTILRAEEQHAEIHRAIDLTIEKMMRQIKRYHNKRIDRSKHVPVSEFTALPEPTEADLATADGALEDDEEPAEVVRRKRFTLKPMSSEEAIDQLELLGHDFFVFLSAEDNQVNVLYRRKNGDYGLIQPA